MTTYLTQLTARVLNPTASLQPRLGSRFEPAPQGLGALTLPKSGALLEPPLAAVEIEGAAAPDELIEQAVIRGSEHFGNVPQSRVAAAPLSPPPSHAGALNPSLTPTALVGPLIASPQDGQNPSGESSTPLESVAPFPSKDSPAQPSPNPQAHKQRHSKADRPAALLIKPLLPSPPSPGATENLLGEPTDGPKSASADRLGQPTPRPTPAESPQVESSHVRPLPKPGVGRAIHQALPLLDGVNAATQSQHSGGQESQVDPVRSQAPPLKQSPPHSSRLNPIRPTLTAAAPAESQPSRSSTRAESFLTAPPPLPSLNNPSIAPQPAASGLPATPSRADLRAAQSLLQPRVEPLPASTLQIESVPQPERTTVNISIGRIEVRAAMPRPAKAQPSRTPAASATSLSTYLHSGGQR